ncbi:MAG: DUF3592 domain-containing protein [Prosthecobacter sp.]|uniref:DUF3592 domain-containing protein n=1 Tax=Prosthecobacter sp. TaxID=1965333 RepID=UPI003BAED85E
MRYLLGIAVALVFLALFLALLFMMPVEFGVSSWHLWRADAATKGRVISSDSKSHRGNTRSLIRYRYTVDGRSYESDRVRAGWISNKAYEYSAGDLAKSLRPGSQVSVRYDSHHPEFALLEYGWPKWSLGFSLMVWGMVFGSYVFDSQDRRPNSHVLYGLTRGMCLLGFVIIFLLPPTIEPKRALPLLGAGLVLSVVAGLYSRLRYSPTA